MAKQKGNRLESLRSTHAAFSKISDERTQWADMMKFAEESGNKAIIQKCENAKKLYDADYEHLASKRAYILGKLIAESPVMFDRILNEVLS